ncbi:MAG TPA: UvrD-helicase domain-containing protein, partial [Solirubrobacteraceae bacterium]|nr:UvrD-helicase domain-containing protein [Solirubrobacteraceae bacterium]
MSDPLRGLTDAQRDAAAHTGGPLLVLGGTGTGKTRALIARFGWLVEQGVPPERIALLASSAATAAALRIRVESVIERAYEELTVATVPELCTRLLHGESPAAGLDPFAAAASGADRLALLLERIDELPLRSHDFQGNPAALLASFIERIDRLKAELVTVEEYAEWA